MAEYWEGEADIVVVGGGSAGVTCAIAAARSGCSVILVEKYGFLGGTAAASMVGPMATFHTKSGKQIIKGIPEEIVQKLIESGGSPGYVKDTIGACSTYVPFEPEFLKLVLLAAAKNSGVKLLFHGWFFETIQKGNEILGLKVVTKGGTAILKGKIFIDASGDGDVAAAAEVPFSMGDQNSIPQPMTLIFKLGRVNQQDVVEYILKHPDEFYPGTLFEELKTSSYIGVSGFFSQWKKGLQTGEIQIPRDRILFFSGVRKGEVMINTTRIIHKNPLNPWDLSEAEQEGREQVLSLIRFLKKYIPGFQDCVLVQTAIQVGIRESRRIHGEYTLTEEDVLNGKKFETGIAKGAYPVDIHDPSGKGIILKQIGGDGSYDIPFQCLIPLKISNLLIAGRCLSATHEALGSCRIQATAMATGQAAGTAAASSVMERKELRKISLQKVRKILTETGAVV